MTIVLWTALTVVENLPNSEIGLVVASFPSQQARLTSARGV
jgi:hypothetical protein